MCEITNVEKLCRLCGSENGIKINIFEPDTEHVKKIHKLLPITVNEHDPLPKHMCHRCTFKINEFYDFRTICLETQEQLKSKIPWLQSNGSGPEAVFVEEPMVQLNVNPLNIPLIDTKEILKSDPLAIEEDGQDIMQVLEPEIVTYSMPSYIGGFNTNPNNAENVNENQRIVIRPSNLNGRVDRRKPINKDRLTKIWKTTRRKRRVKRRKPIRMRSRKETEFVFTPSETSPEISKVLNIQTNNSKTHIDEQHTKSYTTEEGPKNDDFNIVESGENKLPANILVTNIPRVGFVYTCENCARTFLASDSASRHTCDTVPVEIKTRWTEERRQAARQRMLQFWQNKKSNQGSRQPEEFPLETSDNEEYHCDPCGRIFRKFVDLETHMEEHSKAVHHCDICDRNFKRESQLNAHLQQHFNNDSPPRKESDDSLSSWYSE